MSKSNHFFSHFRSQWLKFLVLFILIALAFLLPEGALDPWGLFRLKKITQLIVALLIIQFLAQELTSKLGPRHGALTSGLLAGLISSTALTVSLANKSKLAQAQTANLSLQFVAGTLAMLVEALLLVLIGTQDWQFGTFLQFAPSILLTLIWIRKLWNPSQMPSEPAGPIKLDLFSAFKLAGFIFFVLTLTKILENSGGKLGIYFLTFVVSLFEVHGSIIANVQLFESHSLDQRALSTLLCISLIASLLTKVALVQFLGSANLSRQVWKISLTIVGSALLGWFIFAWISKNAPHLCNLIDIS